jgi:hypothetical protein
VLTQQEIIEDKGRWDKFSNEECLQRYIDEKSVHKRTGIQKDKEDERMSGMFFKMKKVFQ